MYNCAKSRKGPTYLGEEGTSRWQTTQEGSDYAHETRCTRCGGAYIKEIKAGQTMNPERKWRFDTRWMCNVCKFKTNATIAAILAPVVILIVVISALSG